MLEPEVLHKLKQKTFNTAARHLITQGERSIDERGFCRYRRVHGDRVLKCPVGALMEEGRYSSSLEGQSVKTLHTHYGSIFPHSHECLDLLEDLQTLHDSGIVYATSRRTKRLADEAWENAGTLKSALRHLANKHGLNFPKV
jgi:hypothetical protein